MKKLPRYSNEILESHRLCCQDIVGGRLEMLQRQLCCPVQRRYIRRIMDFIILVMQLTQPDTRCRICLHERQGVSRYVR